MLAHTEMVMPLVINILVVDDNESNLLLMERLLQKDDLNIVCAGSGDEALEITRREDFALILLDVFMPGKTGFETAELIRQDEKNAHIPIIFVTAHEHEKSGEFKGYEAGAVDFLYKPVEPLVLKSKVSVFVELYRREKVLQRTTVELEKTMAELSSEMEIRKRVEVQLMQAMKMEAVGTLAGGIAHDFNNILAAIMGYIELAQFDIEEDNKARYSLDQVLKASHRAKKLVSHILAFSRQSGHEKKPLFMQHIVKETIELLRATLPSTISIKQNIHSKLFSVNADPTQVHQILMNLGTNAYHAIGDDGGIIEIIMDKCNVGEESDVDFSELDPGCYVRLSVKDNGCGMDTATLSKIFDPYFTTKAVGQGTGMGLSVVHGIVKSHGGFIHAESSPGQGSVFNLYFPVINAVEDERVKTAETPLRGSERILFVDDEEMLVGLISKMLEKLGYDVVAETNSVKALALYKESPESFDLIISDLTMPDLTGIQLARYIREISPDIPIILCTGYCKEMGEEVLNTLSVDYLLYKPLSVKELAMTMRKAIDNMADVQEYQNG